MAFALCAILSGLGGMVAFHGGRKNSLLIFAAGFLLAHIGSAFIRAA